MEPSPKQVQDLIERGLLVRVRDRSGKIRFQLTLEGDRVMQVMEEVSSRTRATRAHGIRIMRRVFSKEYRRLRPNYLKELRGVGIDPKRPS